eukprot:3116095-Lingulodinium_polyedra.AAC.1
MTIEPPPGLLPLDHMSKDTDYWTHEGHAWTRRHVVSTVKLLKPTPMFDGPDVEKFEDQIVTKQLFA